MEQDEIIRRFVAEYNQFQSAQYQITRWPDKEKENRRSRACDAYAETSNARPLAIEHTNGLTFHGQKQDSARFLRICGALENEMKDAFQCNFSLIIPVFAIQPCTKVTDPNKQNEIEETQIRQVEAAGRRFDDERRRRAWPQDEIVIFLENEISHLDFNDVDCILRLGCPYKVLYPGNVSAP